MGFSLSPEREKLLDRIISRFPTKQASCLPALQLCQEQDGSVTPDAIEYVATKLELTTAQVKGVSTFYSLFQERKVAPNVVWICRTLSCELMGAKKIQEHLEDRLGCKPGGTSDDGRFMLLKAECLAACGYGPMIQLNDRFYENLTPDKVDAALDEHRDASRDLEAGDAGAWMFGPQDESTE